LSDTILAIDIGSTKVCAIIAEIDDEGKLQVQGHGIAKSQGIKKGAITNIELASRSIKKAINDAKRIAGSNITSATVSISNAYAKSLNSTGIVNIPHKDISIKEINRVMQTALYNANVPNEYEVVHVLPYNFRVDDQDFIEDPFGMNASRMEVDVNIIMTQKSNLSNLNITNDLSMALHTPLQIAENVKIRHGNLVETSNEVIELPIIGDEENRNGVSLEVVHSVIFARVEEAFMILAKSLDKSALKEQIGAGIILTGGMTKLKGIRELAQSIFPALPVRIGKPREIDGLFDELKDPAFATVIGLLLYKAGEHTQYEIDFQQELLHSKDIRTDDLGDIKIGNTVKETEVKREEKKQKEDAETESDNIIFDDLPDIGADKQNPIKKLTNWAKQLF